MLTLIENDNEGTIRVHASECRDVARDSRGQHIFVSQHETRQSALEAVADTQDAEVEDIEDEVVFLPCCGR